MKSTSLAATRKPRFFLLFGFLGHRSDLWNPPERAPTPFRLLTKTLWRRDSWAVPCFMDS